MSNRTVINTDKAPKAIGTYSQAVKINDTVYISGQIPLVPETMEMVNGGIEAEISQVFDNLRAICLASGAQLQDIAKLNIYMKDLQHFATVNEIMTNYFSQPYPARAAVEVAGLPKNAQIEMDAILILPTVAG